MTIFQDTLTRRKKEKLSVFVRFSEVLPISRKTNVKRLCN